VTYWWAESRAVSSHKHSLMTSKELAVGSVSAGLEYASREPRKFTAKTSGLKGRSRDTNIVLGESTVD